MSQACSIIIKKGYIIAYASCLGSSGASRSIKYKQHENLDMHVASIGLHVVSPFMPFCCPCRVVINSNPMAIRYTVVWYLRGFYRNHLINTMT
jgi:hypothetical protein